MMRALLDMSTTAQIKDSLKLGGEVLGQIGKVGKLHKGSVEQAGFAVLKAPDIPSILVESAFISNPEEEAKLRDPRLPAPSWSRRWRPASSATSRATRRWRAAGSCNRGRSARGERMLHPQAQALLDLIEERGLPPMHTLPPVEARAFYRDRRAFTQPEPPRGGRGARAARPTGPHGAIPLRLYRPTRHAATTRRRLPVLVYFHGGGWTIGDLDTHDVLCRQLANGSRLRGGRGRLPDGPGAPLPGRRRRLPRRDPLGAPTTPTRSASMPARLAVGGDSAGGNLAAVVAIARARCRRPADRLPAADLSGDRHAPRPPVAHRQRPAATC